MSQVSSDTTTGLIRVRFSSETYDLAHAAEQLETLDAVWVLAASFAAMREEGSLNTSRTLVEKTKGGDLVTTVERYPFPRPTLVSVEKRSPMVAAIAIPPELLSAGVAGAAASFFVYFIRNPGKLGSFIPDVVRGWRRGWSAAKLAKYERELNDSLEELVRVRAERVSRVTRAGVVLPEDPLDELEVVSRRIAQMLAISHAEVIEADGVEPIDEP